MVEKPETNGTHGGRVLWGPVLPAIGQVYQKLIDTADENNQCNDLRTPCVGGRPVFVWRKRKRADKRFGIQNDSATLHKVDEIFSPQEIALIIAFNAAMGLECGGLDILRDQADGRIYIVDVNKTDVGPLIALKWSVKMKSMALLGQALRAWLIERGGTSADGLR
jgi:glutathione synthase/RimK-type ligase-like ATP-grasp enzyme